MISFKFKALKSRQGIQSRLKENLIIIAVMLLISLWVILSA
jgi:hypothetical protein